MPIYEYRCSQCGHEFDFLTRGDVKEPEKCPECDAPNPEKKLSAFAVNTGATPKGDKCNSCSNFSCPYAGK